MRQGYMRENQTKIGDRYYTVVDGDLPESKLAETNVITAVITMNANLKDRVIYAHTMSHELTHAYMYETGFDEVEWSNETVCDFMAQVCASIAYETGYFTGLKFGMKEKENKK
jgi:hypothetical protein